MMKLGRLTSKFKNQSFLKNHYSNRIVFRKLNNSYNQNLFYSSNKLTESNSYFQSNLNFDANKKFLQNQRFFLTQTRLKSTSGLIETLKSSIKQSDETEIDLSNFEIPTIPTSQEIEEMSKIVSSIDLGLTSWMPTGLLFNFFNYIHKLGVEWPITIITTTLIIRTLLVPLQISSRKHALKISETMAKYKNLNEEIERITLSGNMMEMNKLALKYQDFLNSDNFNYLKRVNKFEALKMPIAQVFLFTSFFVTLRKMCYYPIASLENSEFLWIPSLTDKDPFYFLPILTSVTLFATLRIGIDTGTMGLTNANKLQKIMIFSLPIASLLFTFSFPSALCLYWCTANIHALFTANLLQIEIVRKYFNMPKQIKKENTSSFSIFKFQNLLLEAKEFWKKNKIKNNVKNIDTLDFKQFENAGKGPVRKTYKYDPTKEKI